MDAWFKEASQNIDKGKRINIVEAPRRVRVEVDGVELANTTRPRLLYETGLPPRIYIPPEDCHKELLKSTELVTHCPYKGDANYYTIELPTGKKLDNAVWYYADPTESDAAGIKGYVSFYDTKVKHHVDAV
ncbi:hypothetical protein FOMPIDRAFT_92302 [Fomitopsis schrenkii]|uniref:DUF427 domain-containing protein n=1 Tax=Fomitopsis schrenkii TaxID=2126942 RepID=S8FBH8_FOMSC|nr:hypothetical protein FOMPIDRAFT_92302 [Fomitopsis schrenkii]